MEDYLIGALVKIGNSKKVTELSEPQVMQPLQLEYWMVIRTLKSIELLLEGLIEKEVTK